MNEVLKNTLELGLNYINGMVETAYEMHLNAHHLLRNTRHFVGIEMNSYWSDNRVDFTLRPQMRLEFSEHFLLGIVPGINLNRTEDRLSFFVRLIYEP